MSFSKTISKLLIRWRYFLLVFALGMLALAIFSSKEVRYNRTITSMFHPDDPLLVSYLKLKRVFGGNEAIMVVMRDKDLMSEAGMQRLSLIGATMKQVQGVDQVISLAELDRMLEKITGGPSKKSTSNSGVEPEKRLRIFSNSGTIGPAFRQLFAGYTHSADEKIGAVVCLLTPKETLAIERTEIINQARSRLDSLLEKNLEIGSVRLIGESVMVTDAFRMLETDGKRMGWSSAILLAVVILIFFRSLRWTLIPVAVVQFSLVMTAATLDWFGWQLTMVSSMLTALITVIGVATTVHIIVRYRYFRRHEACDRQLALQNSIEILIAPIFWALLTDAVGFGALWFAELEPVKDFAVMTMIGSMMVLVSVLLLVPGLALVPLPKWVQFLDNDAPAESRDEALKPQTSSLDRQLVRPVVWMNRHPRIGLFLFGAIAIAMSIGISRNKIESDFTRNFREDSSIVESYRFVEDNLGGAGVWDLMVPAPDKISWDYLKRIDKLEQRLREEVKFDCEGKEEFGLTKVMSLADAILAASPMDLSKLHFGQDQIVRLAINKMNELMPGFFGALYAEDPLEKGQFYFRIMLRSKERMPSAFKKR